MAFFQYRTLAAWLVALFAVGGAVQALTMQPFQVPDEGRHWAAEVDRVGRWTLSDWGCGSLMGLEVAFDTDRIAWHPEQKRKPGQFAASDQSHCMPNDLNYGGILSYPGTAFALLLSKILPLSPASVFFLARMLQGLLVAGFLMGLLLLATDKTGYWKLFAGLCAALVMLTPIGVQQSFATSPDALLCAYALFGAFLILSSKAMGKVLTGTFLFLSFLACLTKPTLLPLFLGLSWWLWSEGKLAAPIKDLRFWAAVAVIMLSTVVASGLTLGVTEPGNGAEIRVQMQVLKEHPIETLRLLAGKAWEVFCSPKLLNGPLGWSDYRLTRNGLRLQSCFQVAILLSFILPLLYNRSSLRIRFNAPTGERILGDLVLITGVFASLVLTSLFLFLYWTPPHQPVAGFQARYVMGQYVLLLAWLGFRLDKTLSITYRPKTLALQGTWVAIGFSALLGTAFVIERIFANQVRYF